MTASQPAADPRERAVADAVRYAECHEEVIRGGEVQPCEKPSVAVRLDPTEGTPYPVCAYHARADMVPLGAVLDAVEAAHARDLAALRERAEVAEAKVAAVWDEGRESGAYWSSSRGRPVDPRLTPPPSKNPYRAALADRPAGGEATTRAPRIGTEPYRGKG